MKIGVFLSSNDHLDNILPVKLGKIIAKLGHTLVYGGSAKGSMGALAKSTHENGGKVIGVYPDGILQGEPPASFLDESIVVDSMELRKRKLIDTSDVIIVLPGGVGTMEEMFQILTEFSIGVTTYKPIKILSLEGFYIDLQKFLQLLEDNKLIDGKIIHNNLPTKDGVSKKSIGSRFAHFSKYAIYDSELSEIIVDLEKEHNLLK